MPGVSRYFVRHKFLIILVICLLGLIALYLPDDKILELALLRIQQIKHWDTVLLLLLYLPAAVLFIPVFIISLAAGFMLEFPLAVLVISLGSTSGAVICLALARTVFRDFLDEKFANNRKFQALDRAVEVQGFRIVLWSRIAPFLSYNLLNYMYGISQVRFRDYLLGTWLGMLPSSLLLASLGASAKSIPAIIDNPVGVVMEYPEWIVVGLFITIAILSLIYRRARKILGELEPSAHKH